MPARLLLLCLLLLVSAPAQAQEVSWTPADGPYGGTLVAALTVTPAGALLAGTSGGIFRSPDYGASWHPFNDGLPTGDVRALLTLPDGTLLAGLYGDGVYKRTPEADQWTATGLRGVFTLSLAADSSGTWWAGTAGGLLRSTNAGDNWQAVAAFGGIGGGVPVLLASGPYVYAGTQQGVYRFREGEGWAPPSGAPIPEGMVSALTATARGTLFAGTSPTYEQGNLYRSPNAGSWWVPVALPSAPLQVGALAFGPDSTLYAGGFRTIYHSADQGASWQTAQAAPVAIRAFAFAGGWVFAGTSGYGVLRSDDGGRTWTEANTGLRSAVYDLQAAADGTVYAGTAGGVFRSDDGGTAWHRMDTGLTTLAARALALDARARPYAATPSGLFRWNADAQTWEALSPANFPAFRDLAFGPDGALYAGYYAGIYRLSPAGSWRKIPIQGLDGADRDVIALAVGDDGTVYAGSYYDAYYAQGDLTTWTPLTLVPNYATGVQAFLTGPTGRVYAGTRFAGVLRSTGGPEDPWEQLDGGLTGREDFYTLALDGDGTLYGGTYGNGVLRYEEAAQQWLAVSEGLSDQRVLTLTFDAAGNGYAGTVGGGLFRLQVATGTAREAAAAGPAQHLTLQGPYPNPVQTTATLRFDLPEAAAVRVAVFDLLGRRVLDLPEVILPAGPGHTRTLDAAPLPPGLYVCRLTARTGGTHRQAVARMLVVR